jgi:hypothetical protein
MSDHPVGNAKNQLFVLLKSRSFKLTLLCLLVTTAIAWPLSLLFLFVYGFYLVIYISTVNHSGDLRKIFYPIFSCGRLMLMTSAATIELIGVSDLYLIVIIFVFFAACFRAGADLRVEAGS